ncbi:virginiamycin A acetyltransferase [Roseibium hamelinense]|uniref:Virginiamycin A acetyltransferase n=1 Tax=Roseibium hamelinense TaxID=150831 RepID=A0A562SHL8_9HYPH|nr:CatB-related O-acetyltransferase [Roseibium hamelinense]MTI43888.1 CatB-related O-acetyltransferase [Roseibium hamelinense]TWI80817.1 virginiamycin A acetyltransferase [Roseibium hamelinense]
MPGPSPDAKHPLAVDPGMIFLKNHITRDNIEVGEYTYYHDDQDAPAFQDRNVRYHFDFIGDRLVIGKFCALARGTTFIMNGANHYMDGFSTYPFNVFSADWSEGLDPKRVSESTRGDTVLKNDIWLGTNSTVLPGVTIGNGAIIGAHAVVAKDVPDYAIVVGNPGRIVKMRFDDDTINRLNQVSWWDWPVDKITRHLPAIRGADIKTLEAAANS